MAEGLLTSKLKMAAENSTPDEKQFICSICIGHYRNPRYLPTCGHTFCENCLLKYVRATQRESQGSRFGCPVCRKQNDLPGHDEVTLQCVQTFPLNTVIIKLMESLGLGLSQETNINRRICDPCKEEGETITGLKFCLDCKEVLCESCIAYHKKVKLTKKHKLVDVAKMPVETCRTDFFIELGKCTEHPGKDVEIYCLTHDAVVCGLCLISDHKSCEMVDITCHNIDATKLQTDSETLIARMKASIEYCNTLQTLKAETKNDFKRKLKEIRENAQHVRDQVVELMDNVVTHVAVVTKQIEIEREDQLDTELAAVAKIQELTEQNAAHLDTIEQHGSKKQKFVSAHLMNKMLDNTYKHIPDAGKHVKQLDAELDLADNLAKLIKITDARKLVQIKVTESERRHVQHDSVLPTLRGTPLQRDTSQRGDAVDDDSYIVNGDDDGCGVEANDDSVVADDLRDRKLVKFEEHTVIAKADYTPWYSGVAVCRDGTVILSDFNLGYGNYLCMYQPGTGTKQTLTLSSTPWTAVQIDDAHLAVSCPYSHAITIVNVENSKLRVEKILQTQHQPWVIVALNNGQLAVAWDDPPAFGVIDVSGTQVVEKSYMDRDTNGRTFETFEYLAVDERRQHVIQSYSRNQAVYCYDLKGNHVFKYSHPRLTCPQGVALDKYGNIYVSEYINSRIYKLSPTGDLISVIKEGVPRGSRAICSDVGGTGFWVASGLPGYADKVVYFSLQ